MSDRDAWARERTDALDKVRAVAARLGKFDSIRNKRELTSARRRAKRAGCDWGDIVEATMQGWEQHAQRGGETP